MSHGTALTTFLKEELELSSKVDRASAQFLFHTTIRDSLLALPKTLDKNNLVTSEDPDDSNPLETWRSLKSLGKYVSIKDCDSRIESFKKISSIPLSNCAEMDQTGLDEMEKYLHESINATEKRTEVVRAKIDSLRRICDEDTRSHSKGTSEDNSDVKLSYGRIAELASDIEGRYQQSASLAFASFTTLFQAEGTFSASLNKLSKQLLSKDKRQLLVPAYQPAQDYLSRDENKTLRDCYRQQVEELVVARYQRRYLEAALHNWEYLSAKNSFKDLVDGLLPDLEQDRNDLKQQLSVLKGTIEKASISFVFCKDVSDLNLQLHRMQYFVSSKKRIRSWLADQCCRFALLLDILQCDSYFHSQLRCFIQASKKTICDLASECASRERGMQKLLAFTNAPGTSKSYISSLLEAYSQLIIKSDMPTLMGSLDDSETISFISETLNERERMAQDEAIKREERIKSVALEIPVLFARASKSLDLLMSPPHSTELMRLNDQKKMAEKTIKRMDDLEKQQSKSKGRLLDMKARAPEYFFRNPEKFTELVAKINEAVQ